MFRSQCTICTDALTQDLAACPCGHVYHSTCLNSWFNCSKTCPTCRKSCSKSIKLFFSDLVPNEDCNDDIPALKNEIRNNLASLREKDLKNEKIEKECIVLSKVVDETKENLKKVRAKLQQETDVKDALKKQVLFLNENAMEIKHITEELRKTKHELSACERIRTLLSGCHQEAEEMLKNFGNGTKTSMELATQLIIMKRENKKMCDSTKKARSEKEKFERGYHSMQYELKKHELECTKVKKEMTSLNEQLLDAEQEKLSLKKKLEKIQQSFQSPSPRSSIITRLLQESPAPLNLQVQRPTLTSPEDDLFINDREKRVRIITPNIKTVPRQPSSENLFSPIHPGALRLNRKRTYPQANTDTGRFRYEYDGLGGRTKVLMPAPPIMRPKKKVSKPIKISKFMRTMDKTTPSLPNL